MQVCVRAFSVRSHYLKLLLNKNPLFFELNPCTEISVATESDYETKLSRSHTTRISYLLIVLINSTIGEVYNYAVNRKLL